MLRICNEAKRKPEGWIYHESKEYQKGTCPHSKCTRDCTRCPIGYTECPEDRCTFDVDFVELSRWWPMAATIDVDFWNYIHLWLHASKAAYTTKKNKGQKKTGSWQATPYHASPPLAWKGALNTKRPSTVDISNDETTWLRPGAGKTSPWSLGTRAFRWLALTATQYGVVACTICVGRALASGRRAVTILPPGPNTR